MTRNKFMKDNYEYVDLDIIGRIIGNIIHERRKKAKMTIRQLDKLSAVNKNTISRLENGESNLCVNNLVKIAVALDISMCELWFEVDHFCKYGCLSNRKTELIFDESEKKEDEND